MTGYKHIALFLLLIFAQFLACAPVMAALGVDGVRFGSSGKTIRVVIETNAQSDFRAFVLDNPYRLIVDLPAFDWRTGMIERPPHAAVTNVRQGKLQEGYSRIVFDLSKSIAITSAASLPRGDGRPRDAIVIDYVPVSPADFQKHKSDIFGTLLSGDAPQNTAKPVPPMPPEKPINLAAFPPPSAIAPPKSSTPQYKPLVVIDPGHGGIDPGAIGKNNVYEKNVVLEISHELRKNLESTGRYRVLMTRDSDVFIKLRDRVAFARKHKADLFVSIHADSTPRSNARGTSVYTLSKEASDEQTAKLAERENMADLVAGIDLQVEDEQVAYILGDFLMTDTLNQSKFFANTLVRSIKSGGLKLLPNPHRYAGFAVLKAPDVPSVLVETGFMSNPQEAEMLARPAYRREVAAAIAAGIHAYFEHVRLTELSE